MDSFYGLAYTHQPDKKILERLQRQYRRYDKELKNRGGPFFGGNFPVSYHWLTVEAPERVSIYPNEFKVSSMIRVDPTGVKKDMPDLLLGKVVGGKQQQTGR